MFKILHTSDFHIGPKPETLEEVKRTTSAVALHAEKEQPDLIIVAGDTLDEHQGRIRLDSEAARYAIDLIKRLAAVAPVAIVRGTPSHDREAPYIFRELNTRYPVHVASRIEMVALCRDGYGGPGMFVSLDAADPSLIEAVLSFFPSPDKSHVVAALGGESVTASNLVAAEALHDALRAIGEVNAQLPESVPRIMVAHGMIVGSEFSSGTVSTGEDLEFTATDLNLTHTDYKAFGHVHKRQSFAGQIHYCGSPGRLNFGEKEEKGFLMVGMEGRQVESVEFVKTPARRFEFFEFDWRDYQPDGEMPEGTPAELDVFNYAWNDFISSGNAKGADVRVRIHVPEEYRHYHGRDTIEASLKGAGALSVKVEISIIPKVRTRAEGISRLEGLPAKVQRWGDTVGEAIPESVLKTASRIEGMDACELAQEALGRIDYTPELDQASNA